MSFNFRTSIILLFAFLSVVIISIITLSSYLNARQSIIAASEKIINFKSNNIILTIRGVIKSASSGLILLSKGLQDKDILENRQTLLAQFWALNQQSPFYQSVYIADTRGNFVQARKKPNLATRVNYFSGENPHEEWIYRNESYQSVAHVDKPAEYNPLERPWYKQTKNIPYAYWSDVYVWASSKELGITVSYPVVGRDEKIQSVLGIDISLASLNQIITEDTLGKDSVIIIVDKDGHIIAKSNKIKNDNLPENPDKLIHVDDLSQHWISGSYKVAKTKGEEESISYNEIDGKNYFTKMRNLTNLFNKQDWYILFIVPDYEILAKVNSGIYTSLSLAVIMLIISIYSITVIASKLTMPLQKLVKNANLIEQFRFNEIVPLNSNFSEFAQLEQSICRMKSSLSIFIRYVPMTLITKLLENRQCANLGGESRRLVIMSSEISGFFQSTQHMEAQQKVLYLSSYQSELTKVVHHNDGTIDKFIGDRVVAFWGAPIHYENDTYKACLGVLECQKVISLLNRKLRDQALPPIKIRIALDIDDFIVGNFGSEERMFYSILGDGVHYCHQIEELNKRYGTSIIVGESVYTQVKNDFTFRWLDVISLKKGQSAIKIYELVGYIDEYDKHQERISAYETALDKCHNQEIDLATHLFTALHKKYPNDLAIAYQLQSLGYKV